MREMTTSAASQRQSGPCIEPYRIVCSHLRSYWHYFLVSTRNLSPHVGMLGAKEAKVAVPSDLMK